jgi:hypothetical protein
MSDRDDSVIRVWPHARTNARITVSIRERARVDVRASERGATLIRYVMRCLPSLNPANSSWPVKEEFRRPPPPPSTLNPKPVNSSSRGCWRGFDPAIAAAAAPPHPPLPPAPARAIASHLLDSATWCASAAWARTRTCNRCGHEYYTKMHCMHGHGRGNVHTREGRTRVAAKGKMKAC